MSWKTPAMQSPPVSELPKAAPLKVALEDESYSGGSQGSAIVRKWSEYNHQWAGLIVLVAGLLALVSKFQGQRWAGRVTSEKAALVFPALCTACGALLLTHTHATGNIRGRALCRDEPYADRLARRDRGMGKVAQAARSRRRILCPATRADHSRRQLDLAALPDFCGSDPSQLQGILSCRIKSLRPCLDTRAIRFEVSVRAGAFGAQNLIPKITKQHGNAVSPVSLATDQHHPAR